MSAAAALKVAHAAGIEVGVDGDDLVLEASAPPPAAVLDLLSRHKAGIVALLREGEDGWSGEDWLAFFDERAGIAEVSGGVVRKEAEARAFASCVVEWLNRHPRHLRRGVVHGAAERRARRRGPTFGTEPTHHTWLHAECWSQWCGKRRSEASAALEAMGLRRPPTGEEDRQP